MNKKIVSAFLLIAVLVAAAFSLVGCERADKGDIWLERLEVEAVVKTDGSMRVTETWTVKATDGPYRNLYRTIGLYDQDFRTTSSVEDISVRDEAGNEYRYNAQLSAFGISSAASIPSGLENAWYLYEKSSSEVELGLIMPPMSEGERSYTFRYTVTDMVGRYADTMRLYWQNLSTAFSLYVESYHATIKLPGGTTEGVRAWLHCEDPDSFLTIESDKLDIKVAGLAAETQVEVRALIPTDSGITTDKASEVSKFDEIVDEETKWQEEWIAEQKRRNAIAIADIVIFVALLLGAGAYLVLTRYFNRRVKGDYPPYYREIPEGWSPAELGQVFYYYDGSAAKKSNRGKLLSATILDLARRKCLVITPVGSGEDYTIDVSGVLPAQKEDLKPHERILLTLLEKTQASCNGAPFTMDDFERYAKGNARSVDADIKAFDRAAREKFRASRLVGSFDTLQKLSPVLGGGSLLLGVVLFFLNVPMFWIVPGLIAFGLAVMLGTPKIPALNAAGEALYMQAVGLKRYMLDFSNLKEYDIPKLVLWEEYLVYATMMGISKEVVKNLKMVYKEFAEYDARGGVYNPTFGYLYTYMWLSSGVRGGGFDFGGRMDTAIDNIARSVHAIANPRPTGRGRGGFGGFGGGGFGGGGGGFGGGGGGAR